MPHPRSARLTDLLLLSALLLPGAAIAQSEPLPPSPASTETAPRPDATRPAEQAQPPVPPTAGMKPTAAQQAVLDRIRKLRDGDQRRFGDCSYRWDRWKLQPNGSRTTSYSCEGRQIVDHTIGVNCSKLQINTYNPAAERSGSSERGAWGSWRLPDPGGEEQMVATLCANALPPPPSTAGTPGAPPSPPASKLPAGMTR